MLRQEILELGVRRDAGLSSEPSAGKRAGRIRHAQCPLQARATIERGNQHSAEGITGSCGIHRHYSEGVLHDQLAID